MKPFLIKPLAWLLCLLLTVTGYAQNPIENVGIIGSATLAGWDASTPMKPTGTSQWSLTLRLKTGEAKFRANNKWDINWGASAFPTGTGTQNGPNIPVATPGYYTVSFNDASGNYNFAALSPDTYGTVGIVGSATTGGWDASTPMVKDPDDPHSWKLDKITLKEGELKFRANDSWTVNWGGNSFPGGTADLNGANIKIPAGEYSVTFNDVTREYFFKNLNPTVYATVGIIGSATAKGWDGSTPMKLVSQGDPNNWVLTAFLKQGEAKFRANDSWDVNWGSTAFPSGTGARGGDNIPIPEAAYYTISFNDLSGAYNFQKLNPTTYTTVGIIGTATANGWNASTPLTKGADGHSWTLLNTPLFQGEAKFRADDSWTVNWGANTFPTGVGTQGGPNIPIPAGTYNISFNDVTGEYDFALVGAPTGGIVELSPANPTADELVTITYDAARGVSGLKDAPKVYMHSGVVLSGPDGSTWSNVVGNWGQDDGIGLMTKVPGDNQKWQITLPSIRQYYGVAAGVPVFRLGMVFRNAAGTQTGKSASDGDIFVNTNPGDFVRFLAPTASELFALAGEAIAINAEASAPAATITLEINEGSGYKQVAQAANSQAISYNYTVRSATSIQLRVKALLGGKEVIAEKTLALTIRLPNNIVALPAGLRNGINYDPADPTKATLVLLAPKKAFAYVVGDFNNWAISNNYQMNQTPDGEYFWLQLAGLTPGKEYVFQYWVDGTIKIGDPYADKVADPFNDSRIPASIYPNPVAYNRTADGIATVLQTGQQAYQWKNPTVKGGRPAKENLVVYELLLRDFLASHSYKELADTLSYLKRLGVNAIELLPIMEYEGNESWGYNPSYLFAPDKYYGTRNDLKAFIDKAHELGFVVLLDMVLNHQFGQSPMVRMYWDAANGKPAANSPWFNPDATHPFNVGYDFNHESAYTKRYVDDVNRYWLEEYKFDGYRFDLSKGFTQKNNPNDVGAWSAYDQSRIDILKRMTDKIRAVDASAYVIMEHLADNSEEKVLADYGIMLWGNMNHPYNDVVNGKTNTDLSWSLAATRGWQQKGLVAYMESHDEERLMVRARNEGLGSGDYNIKDVKTALERVKLASAFYFTTPGPKMIWQFGELGYDVPIDFNGRTGNKPLPWGAGSLGYYGDAERQRLYKATAAIINLVNQHNKVFEEGQFAWTPTGQLRRITLSHADMNVTIVGNFGVTAGSIQPQWQHTGTWYEYFSGNTFNISSTAGQVSLAPGEFRIYLDKKVAFPEKGLVNQTISCVTATATASKSQLYFGLPGDQSATIKVVPTGGVAPYTVSVTMNRPLRCNVLNDAGDETWSAATGTTTNNTCPAVPATAGGTPVSTITGLASGGTYSVNTTLLANVVFTITVTDAGGCVQTATVGVDAEDVRCLSGKSGNTKVAICHRTGNAKTPCMAICVDPAEVAEHLAHGDYLGSCAPNCTAPVTNSIQAARTPEMETAQLQVGVTNNPAARGASFQLQVQGNNREPITLRVLNGSGKLLHQQQGLRNGQTFTVGQSFAPGIYLAEVVQGRQRNVVKLVKQ